jgi:hypothetical protein
VRNRIPFGYTQFAGIVLVKLNVKLFEEQAIGLVQKYKGLVQWDNGKYGRAIEGTIEFSSIEKFHKDLALARIDAKIERLMEQKASMLDKAVTDNNLPNFDLM